MMHPTLARTIRNRRLHIAAAILVVYALLGFLLLPYLIERAVPAYAQETLQRQASIGQVRVNPFLLTVELNDLRLREADGAPIVGFQRLFADFEISSLFRWAWTFAEIRLDGLDVHFTLDAAGRNNFSRLAEAFPRANPPPPEPPAAPTRLLVQHLRLAGGQFTFTDDSLETPASTTLAPLDLEFENLSTLPEREGPYAVITTLPDGGRLVWHGNVSLQPLSSEGRLYLTEFKPGAFWNFLQERVRLAIPEGELELFTHYRFAYLDHQAQLDLHGIKLDLTGVALRQPDRQDNLLRLEALSARDGRFDLARRELVLPEVVLRNGEVSATLAADGMLDWQRLAQPGPQSAPERAPPAADDTAPAPWNILLESLRLDDIAVRGSDLSRARPLRLAVRSLGADVRLNITAGGAETALLADNLAVQLAGVALAQAERDEPLAELERIGLSGGRVDTGQRSFEAQLLTLDGVRTGLAYDAQGRLDLLEALNSSAAAPEPANDAPARHAAGNAWRLALAQLRIDGARLGFTDQRYQPPLHYDVDKLTATLSGLSNDAAQAARFEASLTIAQGGTFNASGSFAPDGSHAEADLKADNISLTPLKTLVEHYTTLTLRSGAASAATQLIYRRGETAPELRLTGAASIDDLRFDESLSGNRFLAWNALSTQDLAFSLAPDDLTIKQLRVVHPGAKIRVFEDRSVNLGKILKPRVAAAPAQAAQPAAAQDSFPIAVERIRIERGDVDFSDLSLVLPFAAQITNLGGSIAGISSKPSSRATIKLKGRVDEFGSVQVDGGLSPFAPKRYTDIRARFRNIEMSPLSPYTATFAGRKIASGKLSLDLEYKVKDSQLAGDNKILLDQFTLGENIDSPDALDLPLDLAIGLLKDSQGRIDVAVPVTGDVDNPTFSYGKLVGQAIVGMIGKIITAPFRALGSLLGGGGDDLDSVAFEPGSARLPPPQLETLQKVGQALQQRPQLRLIVSGRYAPEHDGAALRAAHVRRELAAAAGIRLDAGEEPPPPAVDQAKTQRELEKLLDARAGKGAVDAFQGEFERTAGRPAEPVNPALALLGKASPDADFYQALYERLVELHPLEDSELQTLAQQRAAAIVQTLLADVGLDQARVAAGKIESTNEVSKDGDVVSKLLLEAGDTGTSPSDGASPAPLPRSNAAPQQGETP